MGSRLYRPADLSVSSLEPRPTATPPAPATTTPTSRPSSTSTDASTSATPSRPTCSPPDAHPKLAFVRYIISATTPFAEQDRAELGHDAPAVVARLFAELVERFTTRGWTIPPATDWIYVNTRARHESGHHAGLFQLPPSSPSTRDTS